MSPPANGHHQPEDQPDSLLHLPLAGLLPDNQKLVINPTARTVVLFAQSSPGEADIVTLQQFSPNGMRVLIPLLKAYPNYCPYETLLAHLFSLTLEEARQQLRKIRKIVLRSIRRAIGSLATGLRAFGLRVRSVRDTGYLVEAIPKASD
jgi:hypothetical protein